MPELNSVFISYRRDVAAFVAQAVWQDLHVNGFDAFYDVESIHADQFDSLILHQIAARPYFMLILTPGSLERCASPNDWVLREITEAVRLQRRIVPLHTTEFEFADIERYLPNEIAAEVKRWNAVPLPSRYFKWAMQEIRADYLKPIALTVTTAPVADVAKVARIQEEAAAAPTVTEQQLIAQEHLYRAYNHTKRGDYAAAIVDYTETLKYDPMVTHAHLNRGIAYKKTGNLLAAIEDFTEAIHLKPAMSIPYDHLGQIYYSQGNYDTAIDVFSHLIGVAPNHVVAYVQRGNAYFATGSFDSALADYERANELLANDESALAGLAIAYHALGHTKEAAHYWHRLITNDPQFRDPQVLKKELNWATPHIEEAKKMVAHLD